MSCVTFRIIVELRYRAMNATQSTQMSAIQQTLEEAAQDATTFRRDSMQQLMKIDSLEQSSRASLRYGHDSMASVASIALSIAEIKKRLSLIHISSAQSVPSGEAQMQCTPQSTGRLRKSSSNDLGLERGIPPQPQAERDLGRSRRLQKVGSAAMFTLGGSSASDGSSWSSFGTASIASKTSRGVSNGWNMYWTPSKAFKEEAATNTIQENLTFDFKIDEDKLDKSAIDAGDDSSDRDDSVEAGGESNVKEKNLFQRADSQPNLNSHRPLIRDMLGQQESAAILGKPTLNSILTRRKEPNLSWPNSFLGESYQVEDLYRIWAGKYRRMPNL